MPFAEDYDTVSTFSDTTTAIEMDEHFFDVRATCVDCVPGTFSSIESVTHCSECAAGTFSDSFRSTTCLPCESGTYAALPGSQHCLAWHTVSCPAGYHLINGNATHDNKCIECNEGQYQSQEDNTDLSCIDWSFNNCDNINNTFLVPGNTTTDSRCDLWTVFECNAGFEFSASSSQRDGECVQCSFHHFQPNNDSQSQCLPWSYADAKDCERHYVFQSGSTIEDSSCVPCEGGFFYNYQFSDCESCTRGFYAPASTETLPILSCEACIAGQYSNDAAETCISWSVTDCLAGWVLNVTPSSITDGTCVACEPGFYQSNDSFSGSNCSPWSVITCDAGEYLEGASVIRDASCSTCEDGYYQPSENSIATECTSWTTTTCMLGTFLHGGSATSDMVCSNCESGYYQPLNNSDATECVSWMTIQCGKGEFVELGTKAVDSICAPCEVGRFQDSDNFTGTTCSMWQVTNCTAGFEMLVQPNSIQDGMCTRCAEGFIQPDSESEALCFECPVGQVADQSTNEATSCVRAVHITCGAGYYIHSEMTDDLFPGDSVCVSCEAGRFQSNENSTATACLDWSDPRPCADGEVVRFGTNQSDAFCESCSEGRFVMFGDDQDEADAIPIFEVPAVVDIADTAALATIGFSFCEICPSVRLAVDDSNAVLDGAQCNTCGEYESIDDVISSEKFSLSEDGVALICPTICERQLCAAQKIWVEFELIDYNVNEEKDTQHLGNASTLISNHVEDNFTQPFSTTSVSAEEYFFSLNRRRVSQYDVTLSESVLTLLSDETRRLVSTEIGLSLLDVEGSFIGNKGNDQSFNVDTTVNTIAANTTYEYELNIYQPSSESGFTPNKLRNSLDNVGLQSGAVIDFSLPSLGDNMLISLKVLQVLLIDIEEEFTPCPVNSEGDGNVRTIKAPSALGKFHSFFLRVFMYFFSLICILHSMCKQGSPTVVTY